MRIAQIAPLYESVPPALYGGTERVVSFLTDELVRQGHEVTLYASGDSTTLARLVAVTPRSLRLDPGCIDQLAHHVLMLERVARDAGQYDILHFHCDYLHYPLSRRSGRPHVTTLHGRLDIPDLVPLYREFHEIPVVSISDSQRAPLPFANWQATVHHGLPLDLFRLHREAGRYVAFVGRVSPEKRLDRAIEICASVGLPLRIAAKVDPADEEYYRSDIEPMLSMPGVEFLGEVDEAGKEELLGGALALLFPIEWPEPFGLVMIESMACGTPVVAYRHGSVPEVIEEGVNGFVVEDRENAARALAACAGLSREGCRASFEERFGAPRMAGDYLEVYRRVIG